MIRIIVKRIAKKDTYTIGKMYINGEYFCDTLEDKDRNINDSQSLTYITLKKIWGETAIPVGTYKIVMNYSNKFKKIMPLLLGVKGYEGVRIHNGVNEHHTQGCILVGENKIKGQLINSRATFDKLMAILNVSDDIKITIE
jgi:hypothetical protein|nr:MAG TPA: hypothetical protein [Siphoviridae sp. ctTYz13]